MFLASIIVRCYRLFIVFVVNQRKKVLFLSQKFQPKQGTTATTAIGADGKPLPAIELSSVSSNDDHESGDAGDAGSHVSESQDSNSVPSVTISENLPSVDNSTVISADGATPTAPAKLKSASTTAPSVAGTNETASTKVSRSSKSSNSSMEEYFDRRTNFFVSPNNRHVSF